MVKSKSAHCRRKATWLAFGLAACAVVASAADSGTTTTPNAAAHRDASQPEPPSSIVTSLSSDTTQQPDPPSQQQADQKAEAARAYKQALTTLSSLKPSSSRHTFDASLVAGNDNSKSIFTNFLPNIHGQGPVGSALRIVLRLHHYATNAFGKERSSSKANSRDMERKSIKVMDLLQHSIELGSDDALYTLGMVSLFPLNQYFKHDPKLAYDSFATHAARTGHASSQAYLAFFHASGYRDVVPVDQGKAQLYYTFAANGGDRGAQMALGYRYWSGIGTRDSCEKALAWYGSAAEQSMQKYLSGPPGGRNMPQTPTRLSDLVGGIYGPGASVASTGVNAMRPAIKAGIARAAGETWADVLEYYQFNAERGETDFAFRLGKIFYQGSIYASPGGIASGSEGVGAIPREYDTARVAFLNIARQVWPIDPGQPGDQQKEIENKPVGYAAASAAYLGRMYLRGEGVKVDHNLAKAWFDRGAEHGDWESSNGLGIMYRDGLIPGRKPDMNKALPYFKSAAAGDIAEAQVSLGKYHFNRGEIFLATTYFENAVRNGSPLEAYYYLGEIQAAQTTNPSFGGQITSGSCAMAVSFYKIVAERGVWEEDLLREAEMAWMAGGDQDKEVAMLKWWLAAERGFEIAQNNLGYILDQDKSVLRLTRFSPQASASNDTASLALTQWIRAAGQRNIDALVKVGDYYYHGLGVSSHDSEKTRLEKAASYYQSAASTQMSALAMWNLGWMYENGVGVPQDFHLAKRHYDQALEANAEAYLPISLSLLKLYARSFWHTIMGGKDGLKLWDPEVPDSSEGKGKTRETPELDERQPEPKQHDADEPAHLDDDEDGPWYFGRAKEDFKRRQSNPGPPPGDEDPIQWARQRRDAERERDSDFGPEDYFEGALRGHREDGEEDDFAETMLLVLICLGISVLLYVRTRIVERMRREQGGNEQNQERRDGNANNGGVFPPPGDPARQDWAILR